MHFSKRLPPAINEYLKGDSKTLFQLYLYTLIHTIFAVPPPKFHPESQIPPEKLDYYKKIKELFRLKQTMIECLLYEALPRGSFKNLSSCGKIVEGIFQNYKKNEEKIKNINDYFNFCYTELDAALGNWLSNSYGTYETLHHKFRCTYDDDPNSNVYQADIMHPIAGRVAAVNWLFIHMLTFTVEKSWSLNKEISNPHDLAFLRSNFLLAISIVSVTCSVCSMHSRLFLKEVDYEENTTFDIMLQLHDNVRKRVYYRLRDEAKMQGIALDSRDYYDENNGELVEFTKFWTERGYKLLKEMEKIQTSFANSTNSN